jgi:hypothetical protein
MKLALYSDLHLEHSAWVPPASAAEADVVLLAGDIASHTHGIAWARRTFACPVIYVSGNHEYYGAHLGMLAEMRRAAGGNLHFLERDALILNGLRFLGCTLWSSFGLHGHGMSMVYAMREARLGIYDYSVIHTSGGRRLEPRDTANLFRISWSWLDQALAEPFDGPTVVITHFAPHRGCIAPKHEKETLTAYFVSDLSHLMQKHRIDLWCHGHTHTPTDFIAEGGCRIISNQRGYAKEDTGFRPNLIIELEDRK